MSTSDRKPFSFFVASPVKIVNIWPSSKEERDEWMVAIKNVVRKPFDGVDILLWVYWFLVVFFGFKWFLVVFLFL